MSLKVGKAIEDLLSYWMKKVLELQKIKKERKNLNVYAVLKRYKERLESEGFRKLKYKPEFS